MEKIKVKRRKRLKGKEKDIMKRRRRLKCKEEKDKK